MKPQEDETRAARKASFKIYKIKDFLRLTETGEIDIDRSKEIVRQLASAASFHSNHNILLDMRETRLQDASMGDVLEVALEFGRYKSAFKGKMANILPDDEIRVNIGRQLKALMWCQEFQYEIFTSFETAVEWLSDAQKLP